MRMRSPRDDSDTIMLSQLLIFLFVLKTTLAQINGEFWWLSDKVTQLKGVEPPQPKFEELSEFDTDESAKIIFRDDKFMSKLDELDEVEKLSDNVNNNLESNSFDSDNIIFPDYTSRRPIFTLPNTNINNADKLISFINKETTTKKTKIDQTENDGDVFIFKYPEDNNIINKNPQLEALQEGSVAFNDNNTILKPTPRDENSSPNNRTKKSSHARKEFQDVLTFKFPEDDLLSNSSQQNKVTVAKQNDVETNVLIDTGNDIINSLNDNAATKKSLLSENICTYMKKNECYQNSGVVYSADNYRLSTKKFMTHLICCVLPLPKLDQSRIIFLDDPTKTQSNRFRRSNKDETTNRSMRQRDFLLDQRFRPQVGKPTVQTKVVTPDDDDYVDPYLNIKGSNIKKQNSHSTSKQDYNYQDYVEDYIVELPRPGLVGLYSDNGQRPPWSFANENNRPSYGASVDDSEEDDEPSFGYSTVDPRRGTTKAPKRGRPSKLTTSLPDESFDVESQTVSFQSTPNFQVLQGFKLLNLGRNKNKFYSKGNRRSTTEGSVESDSLEPEDNGSHSSLSSNQQVYDDCGKTRRAEFDRTDKQFGEAESGSHPWMALVVLTRRPQGILCYATIVHPRAAVTAGDCVFGRTSPKEVILIAGLWNLSDRTRIQNRVVTAQLHPQYRPKVLAHDLALLHWKTPLKLNANIQPACLGNVRDTSDCKFFGWGGFDQGIRSHSRWQRATVLSAQECGSHLAKTVSMPDDGFCATVQSRGTVTGIGGPLICDAHGRRAMSGVAIWRDNALVLIPAQEWLIRAFRDLNI